MNTLIGTMAIAGLISFAGASAPGKPVSIQDLADQTQIIPNPSSKATVLLFVSKDCPYSNGEAPTMAGISDTYSKRGFTFIYVYGNPDTTAADAGKHARDYGFKASCILDAKQVLVRAAGATNTPEAVVYSPSGKLLYKGRIDNKYEGIGYPRTTVTQHDLTGALNAISAGKAPPRAFVPPVGCSIPHAG